MGLGVSREDSEVATVTPRSPDNSAMGCCSSATAVQKTHSLTGLADSCSFDSVPRLSGTSTSDTKALRPQLPPTALPSKANEGPNLSETLETCNTAPHFEAPTAGRTEDPGSRFLLQGVQLERSQFLRLPVEAPLRVLLGAVEIRDRWLEPNVELCCEIRLFQPRAALTLALFPESSYAESKLTAAVKGEMKGGHSSLWLFGEQVAFSGDAVRQERKADGGLQAQVLLIEKSSGDKLAATTHFRVPTAGERQEALWSRATFSTRRVGHLCVAAGWVGSELVGWLSQEVLRRASFGKWEWIAETLDAMGQSEVYDVGSGSCDQEGRCLLDYAAMTVLAEPKAAKVLHRLLDAGIRPRVDNEGLTALHYAAFAGSGDAVTALLRAKACCDAKAHGGITPLMLAALAGSLACARLLWESGADVASVDEQGQTAATWVCLGCGEPPSRSGRHRLLNNGPEEIKSMGGISSGLHEALDRRRPPGMAEPWGGPDRRELLGDMVDRLCAAPSFDGPASPSGAQAAQQWMPILREASKPGPVRCGCFAELYARLRRSQGLAIPLLGAVLCSAIHQGRYWGEQLCRMLLREAVDLPVTGRLPDGRSIVEKALDLGWDDVALLLFDRGASLDSDLAAQARALRAAVEGGHRELAKRLIGQWAEERDAWARPAAPEAEGLAECPVCFRALCEGGPAALVDASGRRTCGHFLCTACATELSLQSTSPRCPVCRQTFQPPPHRPPDPREDPAAWFAFFDEEGSGYLERQLLEKVLPAVVPVDAAKLEASLRGSLWREWDPAGEGRISRKAFCAERGLLRWLAEHLVELNEEREKGPPPPLDQDREGWFRHWATAGTTGMGKAEVLRAVLKSCGTSSLEASAVAASREWIERCWLLWDRDKSGRISLKEFCAEGGLADMMLQQSTLAAAKRVVRRMELEVHDPAALVACCQQLVECAVGIRPEDAVESWPATACRRLRERASQPAREEFEEVLSRGVQQVVLAMQRNNGSAKLFAWGCRALAALVVRPPAQPADSHTWSWADNDYGNSVCGGSNSNCNASQPTLEKMFILLDNSKAATANESGPPMANDVPLWLFVMRQFLLLVPREDPKEPNAKSVGGPLPIAPGALREAGTCALATMRHLCDHTGSEAGNAALEELLAVLKKDERGSAALLAWISAAVAALAADGRALAEVAVQATATGTSAPNPRATGSTSLLPSLSSLLTASARGLKAAGPVRPPSSPALAARVATGLLSSLRRIPATARNGAGGGTTTPAGDGSTRGRVTLRDGHIAVGDVVRLHNDLERAKREQEPPEHFGGWCDRMAFCLDFPGRVVEIPRRSPRMPEVLRISHGALGCWCWNAKAVAEVISDAGLLPFEEDECGPGAALTIGDEVRIDVTVEEAKQLQVNHGGWNDRMTQCCGRVGRLEAIDKAGDMKVLVPGAGAFVWNPRALRSLHAQRWESALCERLCGSIEGTLPLALLAALSCLGCRLDADGMKAAYAELAADVRRLVRC
ncbi:mib1 [Symbiodinium sp. CCMP2456]|nr:mib1 [Symbiodinium sp. CCMP2456]